MGGDQSLGPLQYCRLIVFHDGEGFPVQQLVFLIQTLSCATLNKATYSTLAVDSATVSCFLICHNTGPPETWKM